MMMFSRGNSDDPPELLLLHLITMDGTGISSSASAGASQQASAATGLCCCIFGPPLVLTSPPAPLSNSLCAALGHGADSEPADSEPTDAHQKLSSEKHAACCNSCWFSFLRPKRHTSCVVPLATLNALHHACSPPFAGFPCPSTVHSCLYKSVPFPTRPLCISHIIHFTVSFTRF